MGHRRNPRIAAGAPVGCRRPRGGRRSRGRACAVRRAARSARRRRRAGRARAARSGDGRGASPAVPRGGSATRAWPLGGGRKSDRGGRAAGHRGRGDRADLLGRRSNALDRRPALVRDDRRTRAARARGARHSYRPRPLGAGSASALNGSHARRPSVPRTPAYGNVAATAERGPRCGRATRSERYAVPMPAPPGFEKFLRVGEGRRMKRLQQQAAYITSLEPEFQALSDDELRGKTAEFRERLANGETLEEILFEAYAAVREARVRESNQRMFDVQLMGGIVLHEGDVAEMKTGEGKTFVASLALYLNALPTVETEDGRTLGQGVHLVTVNDYLAKRDAEWNRGVYERLGLTVSNIENMMPFAERKVAYEADITYGTNSEFGFDYLRDNMAI